MEGSAGAVEGSEEGSEEGKGAVKVATGSARRRRGDAVGTAGATGSFDLLMDKCTYLFSFCFVLLCAFATAFPIAIKTFESRYACLSFPTPE